MLVMEPASNPDGPPAGISGLRSSFWPAGEMACSAVNLYEQTSLTNG
jgi:hypothetical protein